MRKKILDKRPSGTAYRLARGEKNLQIWLTEAELALLNEAGRLESRSKVNFVKLVAMAEAEKIVRKKKPEYFQKHS